MTELVLDPVVAGPGLAGLLAMGLVLLVLVERRTPRASRGVARRAGICWALAFVACVGLLANPTWLEELRTGGAPRTTVLIDTSRSMNVRDAGGDSRIGAAARLAGELAAPDAGGGEVALMAFDVAARAVTPGQLGGLDAAGARTELAAALRSALAEARGGPQHLVVLSDGAVGAGFDEALHEARAARLQGVAIVAVPFGGAVETPDLSIELESSEEVGLVGEELQLPVKVLQRGFAGRTATVELVSEGRAVGRREVALGAGASTGLSLAVPALPAGIHRLEVRARPMPGETVTANDARGLTLHVLEEPVRVLVLEGKPYWDLPFMVRELTARKGVAVTVLTRIAPGRAVLHTSGAGGGDTPAASADAALDRRFGARGLDAFDVIVLGRDAEAFLEGGGQDLLRDWIARRGGALVCARGRPTAVERGELARLLPLRWDSGREQRFSMRLTDEGRALRLLPEALEASLSAGQVPATAERVVGAAPLAAVLARAAGPGELDGMPVLATQPYGLGRVVALEGSGRWRTALRGEVSDAARSAQRAFWFGLIRWLVTTGRTLPGASLSIRPERSPVTAGEPARLVVQSRDPAQWPAGARPRIAVDGPGAPVEIEASPIAGVAGAFRADAAGLAAGRHECRVTGPGGATASCMIEVEEPTAEDLDRSARPEVLERLARDTGGELVPAPDSARVRQACARAWSAAHPPQYRRIPAWDRAWVLAAIAVLWSLGWLLRRREGLV